MNTISMPKYLAYYFRFLFLALVFCVVGCTNLATSQRVEGAKPGAGPDGRAHV